MEYNDIECYSKAEKILRELSGLSYNDVQLILRLAKDMVNSHESITRPKIFNTNDEVFSKVILNRKLHIKD